GRVLLPQPADGVVAVVNGPIRSGGFLNCFQPVPLIVAVSKGVADCLRVIYERQTSMLDPIASIHFSRNRHSSEISCACAPHFNGRTGGKEAVILHLLHPSIA